MIAPMRHGPTIDVTSVAIAHAKKQVHRSAPSFRRDVRKLEAGSALTQIKPILNGTIVVAAVPAIVVLRSRVERFDDHRVRA